MAIIPSVFSRTRQQSAPNPVFQSSRAHTPEAFGAGVGRGLQKLGQGLGSLALSFQRVALEEQETQLKSLDVEFSNRVRSLMYGDPENDIPGYLSTQNDDAVDGHVPLRSAIMKARGEITETAGSKQVRDRFVVAADRRVNQAFTQAAQHATTARQSQAVVISNARLANAQNDAAVNPATIKDGLALTQAEIEARSLGSGQHNPEVIANDILERQSALVSVGIAGALGRKEPEQAAAILRQNVDFMTAQDRAKASLSVLRSLTLKEATTLFDEGVALGLKGADLVEFGRQRANDPETRLKLMSLIDAEEQRGRARVRFAQGQDDRSRAQGDRDEVDQGIDLAQEAQDKDLVGEQAEDYVKERSDGVTQEKALQVLRSGEGADASRDRAAYDRFVKERADIVDSELQQIIDEVEDPTLRKALLEDKRNLDPDRFTPTVTRMLKERLNTQAARDRALEAEQLKAAMGSASTAVEEGISLDDFLSTNPGYATELSKSPQVMSVLRAADRARASGSVYADSSDGKTMLGLRNLSSIDLANTDLTLVRHNLTEGEFTEVSRRQGAVLEAVRAIESGDEGSAYIEARRVLGAVLPKNLDYGLRDASRDDREFTNRAEGNIYQAIGNARKQKGGKLSPVEIRDIVYRETAELYVDPPGIFNSDELDLVERKDITSSQAETAMVEASVITDLAMRTMATDAQRGTKYKSGIPLDIARQAYASFIIAKTPSVSVQIRREAFARYKRLLTGE